MYANIGRGKWVEMSRRICHVTYAGAGAVTVGQCCDEYFYELSDNLTIVQDYCNQNLQTFHVNLYNPCTIALMNLQKKDLR